MRSLTSEQIAALSARSVVRRVFLSFDVTLVGEARIRVNAGGDLWADGDGDHVLYTEEEEHIAAFWEGDHPIELSGVTFAPIGEVASLASVSQVADLSVPGLAMTFSGIRGDGEAVINLIRGLNRWHQKRATVAIGLFDPATRQIVGSLIPVFLGVFDKAVLQDGAPGEETTLAVTLESVVRELTNSNPQVRSDEDQRSRFTNDDFFTYCGRARDLPLYWNETRKSADDLTKKQRRRQRARRRGR